MIHLLQIVVKKKKIDSQEKVKLGTTYYYQVEEKEKPNKKLCKQN